MAINYYKLSDVGLDSESSASFARKVAEEARQPRNGEEVALRMRIAAFEQRYEMVSSVMVERLRKGEIRETADVAHWLFLLNAVRSR